MIAFVIRRVLVSIPVLIVSTILTFLLVKLMGNPLSSLIGRNPPVPKSTIEFERHKFYLNHSLPAQYWHWIENVVVHGNFGPSLQGESNVRSEIIRALGVTSKLIIGVIIIALILAVASGVYSAVRQYSATDYISTFAGFLFLSMPSFWFGALLKQGGIRFNSDLGTHFFGTIGDKSVYLADNSTWGQIKDVLGHTILPVITLALISYAAWSRFTRASMLEVLNSDYVRLARSKGLSRSRVLVRHALRTALIPLATVTALDLAGIIGGAVITETVFQWHGMGDYLLQSIRSRDVFAVEAWLLVFAVVVILFNLIADLLYAVLDPRIRYD